MVRSGLVRRGAVWLGQAGSGKAWRGKVIEHHPGIVLLRFRGGQSVWRGEVW
jgi:hypothetical protein